jgi:hypothetical protein
MHNSDDKLRVNSGVAVAKHAVDLVARQFEAVARLRFRHWIPPWAMSLRDERAKARHRRYLNRPECGGSSQDGSDEQMFGVNEQIPGRDQSDQPMSA